VKLSAIDKLVEANDHYASSLGEVDSPAPPPARKLAVVTCMDARLLTARFLGLEEGDAHIIRNAGGRTAEALRSLVISQRMLGTNAIAVIQHTDCGMLSFSNEELYAKVEEDLSVDASDIDFLPFRDLEQTVRHDVDLLRRSPLIADDTEIRGFVYDVGTRRLTEVG
jgi:carbonic anhydrase